MCIQFVATVNSYNTEHRNVPIISNNASASLSSNYQSVVKYESTKYYVAGWS